MRVFKAFYMTFGTFCAVPLPVHVWDEDCADLMMPCLPVVGFFIGVIWWGIAYLIALSGVHTVLAAAILSLVMFFAAGLIHLDGYMDTSDAVLSRRPLEEKMRILKDPHTGSFAVIMVAALFIMQFAAVFAYLEKENDFAVLYVIPTISRCCSAMSMLCLKPASHSSYTVLFRKRVKARHKIFLVAVAALMIALVCLNMGACGLILTGALLVGYIIPMACVYRNMKGVSGDLVGFSLVVSELCGIIALALVY